ncbi:hypothetical protein [Mesonia aestuariivivens]|uniref:WxL domain-containing protein n=1 Tax=Mesonia aestuariivivens TaxID=2796128 RepID=A0ABS6W1V9_9FLAO|nr:hypothetical protein [Mesonia aestuariivivens]MBW2961835.1 hypothetical protein [Mesonia aestuariivivens]
MKKLVNVLSVVAVMLSFGTTFAQEETVLTVNVAKSYSIEVNQAAVAIDMNLPSHFTDGNDSGDQTNHLEVIASSAYKVTAQASSAVFNAPSGASSGLNVSNVQLTLTDNGDQSGNQSTLSTLSGQASGLPLSNNAQDVVSANGGDLDRGFNVNYAIPAENASNFLNLTEGAYTTTITYSIIPQ